MLAWGMIGTGEVAESKSGPAFYKAAGSTLYAVCNRTYSKAVDYAKRHNVPVVYKTVEALLSDPRVDCVYVATPPYTHKELALQVIAAGKPLCLEKPMAMNSNECRAIVAASEKRQVPVYVTYYRRSQPKFIKIKELLENGNIGRPGSVQVTQYQKLPDAIKEGRIPWRFSKEIAGGGILVDMGSHVFDILDFIIGPVKGIEGYVDNYGGHYEVEDIASASFLFDGNITGCATFNFNTVDWQDTVEICGETGRLVFSVFDERPVEIHTAEQIERIDFTAPDPVYLPFVEDMVARIGQGDTIGYAYSAMRTTSLLDRLLKTYTK